MSKSNARYAGVHIGLHKTGTTFLQRRVFPKLGGTVQYWASPRLICQSGGWAAQADLPEDLQQTPILVSSEGISGTLYRNDLSRVRALKSLDPEIRIIVSIRRQDRMLRSLYWQAVKSGFVGSYRKYQQQIFGSGKLDYFRFVEEIRKDFGADRVLVLLFEDIVALPDDVLRDVERFLGAEPAGNPVDRTQEGRSPSDMVVLGQGLLNRVGLTQKRDKRLSGRRLTSAVNVALDGMSTLAEKLHGGKLRLYQSQQDRHAIREHYRQSNENLLHLLGQTDDSHGYVDS